MKSVGFLLFMVCSIAFGQTGSLKGRVLDASTNEALPFCNVFFDGTTLGTTSDQDGNFEIRNVPVPGTYEVIFSYVGYESFARRVEMTQANVTLGVTRLKPSQVVLSSVEVKSTRDKDWEKKLKWFTKTFLGTDRQSRQCTITNPWVISFPESDDGRVLLASASGPIEIENKALGYKIKFLLYSFATSAAEYSINGKSFFEEMQPENDEQLAAWKNEREQSYRNSKQYLFRSIVERRINAEGFRLFTEIEKSNGTRGAFFSREVGKSVLPCDTTQLVSNGPREGQYTIRIPRRLEVHNTAEKDNSSIYRDALYPISWVESKRGSIVVNKEGFEIERSDVVTLGVMNNLRISRLVPFDYKPDERNVTTIVSKDLGYLHEKIYVHTDRPYYYGGETIWFGGYIKYGVQSLKDSLSTTVYAELINSKKQIVLSKTLDVLDGTFNNQLELRATMQAGDYYLRCYTRFNRNFGDERLYVKYIPILEMTQAVNAAEPASPGEGTGSMSISVPKSIYKLREKIEVTLLPEDYVAGFMDGAHFSVSVTDMKQVMPVQLGKTIGEEFEFAEHKASNISYPVEYGVDVTGIYLDRKGNPQEALLSVIQLQPRKFMIAHSDANGRFGLANLYFYDSVRFVISPGRKDKPTGFAKILPRDVPPVHLPLEHPKLEFHRESTAQRSFDYETDKVTVLKEVTVTGKRIEEEHPVRAYGRPDHVIQGKDIKGSPDENLLTVLPGRVPGLAVRQFSTPGEGLRWLVFLSRNGVAGRIPPEVSVRVNGNLMYGRAEDILRGISLKVVSSVEINRNSGVYNYGNTRTDGILSINTVYDQAADQLPDTTATVVVHGFDKPMEFKSPDYSLSTDVTTPRKDFRSTIYWNPAMTIDEDKKGRCVFYAGDLATQYRIEIEGMLADGTAVHVEKIIEVTDQ
ncbi:MAG TPA: carboxypeptidase-like regulatory domain-containing protein [Cyclobacteriaceae bacterium]|nr:carboxypeptidase-like regulatory domain-containing protein [Cyclobacteriaceae bacterium]